jgi:hypothetical protein
MNKITKKDKNVPEGFIILSIPKSNNRVQTKDYKMNKKEK